jgi:hypothetical protein
MVLVDDVHYLWLRIVDAAFLKTLLDCVLASEQDSEHSASHDFAAAISFACLKTQWLLDIPGCP